jgi:hypothetical protein
LARGPLGHRTVGTGACLIHSTGGLQMIESTGQEFQTEIPYFASARAISCSLLSSASRLVAGTPV